MHVANNRAPELRNFADVQYLQAPAGQMLGGTTRFLWEALVRCVNIATPGEGAEWIFGNSSNAGQPTGFALLRIPDQLNAQGAMNSAFVAVVYDGAGHQIQALFTVPFAAIMGMTMLISCEYDALSGGTPVLRVFVNGAPVVIAQGAEPFTTAAPSAGQATIGYRTGALAMTGTTCLAAGYAEYTDSEDSIPRLAKHFDEVMKRANLPDIAGYNTADAIEWLNNYDVAKDCGSIGTSYPRSLTNVGSNGPDGDLVLTGGGTTLQVGIPQIQYANVAPIAPGPG